MKKYFLQLNGHKAGPYTRQQIDLMREGGVIGPETQFWTEGLASWVPVAFMNKKGGIAARPALQAGEKNYHIPYCMLCREFVSPRVAAETVGGTNYGFKKFCPRCGEEVLSQKDLDSGEEEVDSAANGCSVIIGILLLLLLIWLLLK